MADPNRNSPRFNINRSVVNNRAALGASLIVLDRERPGRPPEIRVAIRGSLPSRAQLWGLIVGDVERGSESLGEIVCGCNAPVVQKHYPGHVADHVLVNRNDVDARFP
jgi:hypothetical protein